MDRLAKHISSYRRRSLVATALALTLAIAAPTSAIQGNPFEGTARGYPVIRDLDGRHLADGDFAQWVVADRLHVRISYRFPNGRTVVEELVARQRPELIQDSWSFRDLQGGRVLRAFAIDFQRSVATGSKKDEDGETTRWSETLDIERGHAFAGFGFSLAIKAVRTRLVNGETVVVKGVGFTPKPRLASVALTYGGRDRIRMGGRVITADRFVIHPKVPVIARWFVNVPDATIWLTPPPAGFLRWEGALAEPDDQKIRVDLLPGGVSEAARPIAVQKPAS